MFYNNTNILYIPLYTILYIHTQETARSKAEQHNSRFPYGFQGEPDLNKIEKEVEKRSLENLLLEPYHLNQKRFGVIYATLDALLTPVPASSSTSSSSSSSSSSTSTRSSDRRSSTSSSSSGSTAAAEKGSDLSLTLSGTTNVSGSDGASTEAKANDLSATASIPTTASNTLTKRHLQQVPEHTTATMSASTDAIAASLDTSHISTTTVKDTITTTSTTPGTGSSRKATDAIRGDASTTTSTTTSSTTLPTTLTSGVVSTSGGSEYDDKQQRKRDPRKKISLATMYNLNGTIGNTAIWNTAVEYLYTHKILNFKVLLPLYLTKERESCVYMKSLLYPLPPPSSSATSSNGPEWSIFRAWTKIWARFWVWPAVLFQNLKDPECGIIYCDADTIE